MADRSEFGWVIKFLALCVVVAVTVFWWLFDNQQVMRVEARNRFFDQYNEQQLLIARQVSSSIEDLFATLRRNLGVIGGLYSGTDVTIESSRERATMFSVLYGLLSEMPVIDLVIFDDKGKVVHILPEDSYTLGRDYSWRDYFKWAAAEGRPGDMYLSPFMRMEGGQHRGGNALIVAEGIYGEDGHFKGVAMFTLDFDALAASHVRNVSLGEDGYAWLVDSGNRMVLVDPAGRLGGQSFDEAFSLKWPKLFTLLEATRSGEPGMDRYEYEDPDDNTKKLSKLVGYAPVRIGNQLWTLGVCTPEREVEAMLESYLVRTRSFSTTALVAVFAGAAVMVGMLLGLNRTLKAAVASRTAELSRAHTRLESTFEELLEARKAASVGNMALGLVHEVRNPLSAIRMNMQMLRKKMAVDEHTGEHFKIMDGEIVRLNKLIGDVMSYARPHEPSFETVELRALTRDVARLIEQRAELQGIKVRVEGEPGQLMVVADGGQIKQVLLNLAMNALEAMEEEGPPGLLTFLTFRDADYAAVKVKDTGPGMSEEMRERIFEPFFTGKSKGLGLGLAIVEAIVSRHNGSITLDTPTGHGASFTVRLPLRQAEKV